MPLAAVVIAWLASTAVAQPPNSSALLPNATRASVEAWNCHVPVNGLSRWYMNSRTDGPYDCYYTSSTFAWAMVNAYRSGGTEGVHWKYTNDVNDPDCLENWVYYGPDGNTFWAFVQGRTTTERDPRRWCALPVYRPPGIQGKQWQVCDC